MESHHEKSPEESPMTRIRQTLHHHRHTLMKTASYYVIHVTVAAAVAYAVLFRSLHAHAHADTHAAPWRRLIREMAGRDPGQDGRWRHGLKPGPAVAAREVDMAAHGGKNPGNAKSLVSRRCSYGPGPTRNPCMHVGAIGAD